MKRCDQSLKDMAEVLITPGSLMEASKLENCSLPADQKVISITHLVSKLSHLQPALSRFALHKLIKGLAGIKTSHLEPAIGRFGQHKLIKGLTQSLTLYQSFHS